ncbi:hypothetical protein Mapa_005846 [Marchantia paleacea]|nr:hypothetical protein Mapa_005846 [Marchantia paleacea]
MAFMSLLVMVLLVGVKGVAAAFDSDEEKKWVQLHGWLMWASMGFLLPVGILLVRWTKPMTDVYETPSSARVWTLFYLHIIFQVLAIALATGGAAVLFVKVGTQFDYTHQRLGLSIMCLIWFQPVIGLLRPAKGSVFRSIWYAVHWLFGTGAMFLGIINIYIGVRIYEFLSGTSIRTLNIIFSISVAVMCFLYLLQDRCGHIVSQGRQHKPVPQHSLNL